MQLFYILKKPSEVAEEIKKNMITNMFKYMSSFMALVCLFVSLNMTFFYFYYSEEIDSANIILCSNFLMTFTYVGLFLIMETSKYRTHHNTAVNRMFRNYVFFSSWVQLIYAAAILLSWALVQFFFHWNNFYLNFESIYFTLNLLTFVVMSIFTFINLFYSGFAS